MAVQFCVSVTNQAGDYESDWYDSVLDAVEDYQTSVMNRALQDWSEVVLQLWEDGEMKEVLENFSPSERGFVPLKNDGNL